MAKGWVNGPNETNVPLNRIINWHGIGAMSPMYTYCTYIYNRYRIARLGTSRRSRALSICFFSVLILHNYTNNS